MKSDQLQKHILATYFSLRIGAAAVAFAFPFILWLGGEFFAGLQLQKSMSDYYFADAGQGTMRDWFVGGLFTVGAVLYLYKGYSNVENNLLNAAGLLAVGTAVFPTEWNCAAACKFSIHGFCAVAFFVCIAVACVWCSGNTLKLIQDPRTRQRFKRIYTLIGVVMVASPAIAYVFSVVVRQYQSVTFYAEACGILAFATYWVVKSRELSITHAEKRAVHAQMET